VEQTWRTRAGLVSLNLQRPLRQLGVASTSWAAGGGNSDGDYGHDEMKRRKRRRTKEEEEFEYVDEVKEDIRARLRSQGRLQRPGGRQGHTRRCRPETSQANRASAPASPQQRPGGCTFQHPARSSSVSPCPGLHASRPSVGLLPPQLLLLALPLGLLAPRPLVPGASQQR